MLTHSPTTDSLKAGGGTKNTNTNNTTTPSDRGGGGGNKENENLAEKVRQLEDSLRVTRGKYTQKVEQLQKDIEVRQERDFKKIFLPSL